MKWIGMFALMIVLMTIPFQSKEEKKIKLEPKENIFNVEWLQQQVKERRELELVKQQEIETEQVQLSKEILLIARVVQAEGLNQSYEGKKAIASVIMNRAGRDINNVIKVIYKKNAFSSVSRGNRLFNSNNINEDCIKAAIEVVNGVDNVDGATNFINPRYVNPSWTKKLKKVKTIGDHTFYKYNTK